MYKHCGILIAIFLSTWVLVGLDAAIADAGAARNAKEPATTIIVDESIGTAWPITSGYLVTNNHVVADAASITLIDQSGRAFTAWPVLLDELYDIAFLEVADPQDLPPALALADSRAKIDTPVFTVGFPEEESACPSPKQSAGKICGLNGTGADPASYRTTVAVKNGNSGGPLMNLAGEVVGVVRSMIAYRDETTKQMHILKNASCAVKADAVKDLLALLPEKDTSLRVLNRPDEGSQALCDAVTRSVMRVVARRWEPAPGEAVSTN